MILFKKKEDIHNCPRCDQDWDLNALGWKEKNARRMAFMGQMITVGFVSLPNPFYTLLPPKEDHPEEWCNSCLRDYMNLDSLSMDWTSLGVKVKENEENEPIAE